MKKFFTMFAIALTLGAGIHAFAETRLNFHPFPDPNDQGTVLTPTLEVDGTPYGFYDLEGNSITINGTINNALLPPRVTQQDIVDAIQAQYVSNKTVPVVIFTN